MHNRREIQTDLEENNHYCVDPETRGGINEKNISIRVFGFDVLLKLKHWKTLILI